MAAPGTRMFATAAGSWLPVLLLLLLHPCRAIEDGKRVLALLEDPSLKDEHSLFFGALSQHGFDVKLKQYSSSSLKLSEYDTWLFDHLILFAPKAISYGGDLKTNKILEFIDSGHNVILVVTQESPPFVRTIAAECGVRLDEAGSTVFDHFEYVNATDHTLIASKNVVKSEVITGGAIQAPVLFRGIAQTVPGDSELLRVALSASGTAYSYNPKKPYVDAASTPVGSNIALVTLLQARNNARVLIAGSLEMFSDKFFTSPVKISARGQSYPKSGNQEFLVNAALWTFQQRGVLQATQLHHHILGSEEQPSLYRINDEVEFSLAIHERDHGKWKPYKADDVQVEFVMLDPHVRLTLSGSNGLFKRQFKVPDVYGVFKYVITYHCLGYSNIDLSHQVPVRPYRHDEYERFLITAYPYYASAFSSMLAFFILGFFYLYHK